MKQNKNLGEVFKGNFMSMYIYTNKSKFDFTTKALEHKGFIT